MVTSNYYKRFWEESTGNELTNSWGCSTYYFETEANFAVLRQMEIFENGQVLKYNTEYLDDKFGGLSEVPLDFEDFEPYRITRDEFETRWQTSQYKQFPEIVCTHDVLWGQPRLEGRRLAVGDIVSLVNVYDPDNINTLLTDFELSLQQVRQALHYCKILQCKKDNPEKFCYNCILRVEQENDIVDKDDPEQPNWIRANRLLKKYFQI
jgi:uncharacterized protein (DUF433 family)